MMGFGAYGGNGGSSSLSSNLSASAQPFTVERPIAKPATTPLLDLNEASFNPPLNSSLQNWVNPCRPDYLELDSMPDAKSYRFSGPNPFNQPQTAPSPSLDPSSSASNDAFSYNPNPDCSKNDFVETKPYYPSYVLPSPHFTTPHVATFNGSSHDQRLSDLEHTTKWGGLWESFPDWGHSKKVDANGSFYSNEMNVTSPSIYEDHMNLGAQASKVMKTFEETSPGTCMLSKEKQVESANTEKLDYLPVIGQTPSSTPNFVVPDLKITLGKPVKPKKNIIPFSNPYGNFMRAHGTASTNSLSPALVIRPPAIGSSSSAFSTVPSKNVNTVNDATHTDSTQNYPPTMKERCAVVGPAGRLCFDPIQLSINLDGNSHPSAELSSGKNELSSHIIACEDTSDQLFCMRSGVEFSGVSSNGFNMTAVNNVGIQVENSSESSDHYNPAVDSPCWKGAPVPLYSPFGSSEAVTMQLLKKPEACGGSNGQASKHIPVLKLSYEKPGETSVSEENCCLQNGLLPSAQRPSVSDMSLRVNQPNDVWKVGSNHGRPSSSYRFEISDNTNQTRKEYSLFNKSTNESNLMPCTMQQIPEEETSLCSPSFVDDILVKYVESHGKESESHGKESAQMINVNALIDTMHNLSELLLFHCSNEECELKKQDYEALKIVISNLDDCMPKNIGLELSADPNKGKSMGNSQTKAVDILREPPHRHLEEKRNYSGEKDGESSGFLLVRDHAEMKVEDDKNHEMTQAIKRVLSENFHEKEEIHPQILLYKNLWLEAEAALCSVNYMARYNRMKMEMEQCKLDSAKVLSEDTTCEKQVSKVSSDIKTDEKSTPASDGGPSTDVSVQDSPIIDSSSTTNDIITRFRILKNRLENLNSNNALDKVKIPSPKVCSKVDKVDKLDPEVNYSQISEVSTLEDNESSVMTGLHILKNHGDNLSSMDMEWRPLPDDVDLGFAWQLKQWPVNNDRAEEGMSDANMEPVMLHEVVNTVKEFHLQLEHDSISQSPGSNRLGNPVSAGCYDSSSSDWEHVLEEELSEQNS